MSAGFTEFQLLLAVRDASGNGHPRARNHATPKMVAAKLDVTPAQVRELLAPLVDAGLLEIYQVKRRTLFDAYRLTPAGESALGVQ